jgi:hypothetical protein
MRKSVASNILLCVAAVLLIPQALECCHGQAHTVLESLTGTGKLRNPDTRAMPHHHHGETGHQQPGQDDRPTASIDGLITDDSPVSQSSIDAAAFVTAPSGEAGGQSPNVGADMPGHPPFEVNRALGHQRASDASSVGRPLRPAIPPPRE